MDRISEAEGALNDDGKLRFTDGDPSPTGHAPSRITARFLNIIMEELANLVEASKQQLDPNSNDQILKAIQLFTEFKEFVGDEKILPASISGNKLKENTIQRSRLRNEDFYIKSSSEADLIIVTEIGSQVTSSKYEVEVLGNMFGIQIRGKILPTDYKVIGTLVKGAYGLVSFDLDGLDRAFSVRNLGLCSITSRLLLTLGSSIDTILDFQLGSLSYQFQIGQFDGMDQIREITFSHDLQIIDPGLLPEIAR